MTDLSQNTLEFKVHRPLLFRVRTLALIYYDCVSVNTQLIAHFSQYTEHKKHHNTITVITGNREVVTVITDTRKVTYIYIYIPLLIKTDLTICGELQN